MLVHLSKTSPYLCDISLGPIEQANRMASASAKRLFPYLDLKESFPKQTRTPLKLLAPDEVPLDSSPAISAADSSRQASLQPIWYTEQTIVDDHPERTRSTLPTIESDSPEELLPSQPSLMRKSSTFTIDQRRSIHIPSALNESEKENDENIIMTSTQKDTVPRNEPSEESFRALEHLLGLGSTNINLTMTTTTHESPKSNHDTLSLTIVTPTELINNSTATSFHMSYAPAGGGSLPSSQNILLMPTIESITEPSMNSTVPPPFSVDNSDMEEPSSAGGTPAENLDRTEESFRFTDDDDEQNFSSEFNSSQEIVAAPPLTVRAPTSADVAYRALVKPRAGGRSSQPVKTHSPLAQPHNIPITVRSSVPALPSRALRSSTRRISITIPLETSHKHLDSTVTEDSPTDEPELAPVISTSESPNSAEEADRSASSSDASPEEEKEEVPPTPIESLNPVLSREFTYNTPTVPSTRASERCRRRRSTIRSTRSCIPSIENQPAPITEEEKESSSDDVSLCSMTRPMLPMLSTNPTVMSEAPAIVLQKSLAGSASPSPNPTPVITVRPSEHLSSNLSPRRSIYPLHSSTPSMRHQTLQMISIGEEEQLSTTVPQQLNMDSSVEEVDVTDKEQQVDIPIQVHQMTNESVQTSPVRPICRVNIAVQTTPSLDPASRRQFQTMEQQTTPVVPRSSSSSSCQTTPVPIVIQRTNIQQTSPPAPVVVVQRDYPQQITPIHSKAMMHLRRNVRFQFTPSTDARLAAKEKQEEEEKHLKKDIVIVPVEQPEQEKVILSDNEREEDTEDETRRHRKAKKKKSSSSSSSSSKEMKKKSKTIPPLHKTDESSEETADSPVLLIRRADLSKDTTDDEQTKTNDIDVTSNTTLKKKRSARLEKIPSPVQEPEVIVLSSSPTVPTKRTNRKRSNPKTSAAPSSENTSPTEPVTKRVKTNEVKQPVLQVPSPETHTTRTRSKAPKSTAKTVPSPPELPPAPKKSKKASLESSPVETAPITATNKRKNATAAMKKGKRRLHSVEQDEGLNTADEEEVISLTESVPIDELNLSQDEREKIEASTVAELKTRLIGHGETIPKGVRKADLVALLLKIELQLLKERKETEVTTAHPTSRKTRRKK